MPRHRHEGAEYVAAYMQNLRDLVHVTASQLRTLRGAADDADVVARVLAGHPLRGAEARPDPVEALLRRVECQLRQQRDTIEYLSETVEDNQVKIDEVENDNRELRGQVEQLELNIDALKNNTLHDDRPMCTEMVQALDRSVSRIEELEEQVAQGLVENATLKTRLENAHEAQLASRADVAHLERQFAAGRGPGSSAAGAP